MVLFKLCKNCNYKIGDRCWYHGEMTPKKQLIKNLWGCKKFHPWWINPDIKL